jgi:YggT family protein
MNLFQMLATLLQIYSFVLLARALISWIPNLDPDNPGVRILYQLTEPILEPIRRIVPPLGGMMDVSLIIAWFATIVLQRMLLSFA